MMEMFIGESKGEGQEGGGVATTSVMTEKQEGVRGGFGLNLKRMNGNW